jgi:hypothetical protein
VTFTTQPIYFATAGVEVARFDASGNLFIGSTANIVNARLAVSHPGAGFQAAEFMNSDGSQETLGLWNQAISGNPYLIVFYAGGAQTLRGSITYNYGTGLVTYNTASDERLKSQFDESGIDWGDVIDNVYVGDFVMKGAEMPVLGIVAQRLVGLYDQAITPPKDDDTLWQADYSQLAPLALWGAKNARARIAVLEARIDALEKKHA